MTRTDWARQLRGYPLHCRPHIGFQSQLGWATVGGSSFYATPRRRPAVLRLDLMLRDLPKVFSVYLETVTPLHRALGPFRKSVDSQEVVVSTPDTGSRAALHQAYCCLTDASAAVQLLRCRPSRSAAAPIDCLSKQPR